MERHWLASVVGGLLVSGLATTVLAVAVRQADPAPNPSAALVAPTDGQPTDNDERAEKDSEGAGPPPWAHAHKNHAKKDHARKDHAKKDKGPGGRGRSDQAWKEAWQKLTPAQREKKMSALAEAHAQGMKKWADCVAAAGTDPTKRAACEKPLPPGLAKRLP